MTRRSNPSAHASRPHAVLLDLGGVIIDIDPHACFVSWAGAAGVEVESIATRWAIDDAYKAFEVGTIDFNAYTESLSRRLGIALPLEQWRAGWNELLREPFADVAAALRGFPVPLYAFSNTNHVHQAVWQERLAGILGPFRKVYTSCALGARKPDADAYRRVADDMDVEPGNILFIDDNRGNVAGAEKAGLDARWVANSTDTVALLERARVDM